MDVKVQELRFDLKDKGKFNAEEVKKALKEQGFPVATVRTAPGS